MSYSRYTPVCWGCGVEISSMGPGYCNTCRQEKAMREQARAIQNALIQGLSSGQSRIDEYINDLNRYSRRRY